ncbi:uncharacterized protein K489DRAFT_82284 [Dissoconium aciculare CBS 342.82]|uniref:Secreted protein n=1 Tax=Dissoconium aciculare CBS 342.82 TaxID=1314786 RepID=A0A6J3LT94_9PEZI|nr:uncharacterized protein K489DRAFT_82284 [Dissoconium aciculare CBS 342.82]KAF1818873.1 hypothetical protein K489DRAFT_82284 [Dissoconium aciculare CBS 342.82]
MMLLLLCLLHQITTSTGTTNDDDNINTTVDTIIAITTSQTTTNATTCLLPEQITKRALLLALESFDITTLHRRQRSGRRQPACTATARLSAPSAFAKADEPAKFQQRHTTPIPDSPTRHQPAQHLRHFR